MMTKVEIIQGIKNKQNLYKYKVNQLEEINKAKVILSTSLATFSAQKETLDNIIYTCKLILEKLTYTSKAKLERFLTHALKSIFTDRDYSIQLVLKEDTKKPGLELTLIENGANQEITDAVGGGIISTLGLLFQIYYIEVYKLNRIMFIDEGLKEVSTGTNSSLGSTTNYLENLLVFLNWLAKEKNYSFVIVTHDNSVRQFANKVYEVNKGVVKEC